MTKYTVVLLRPDYFADPYGQDTYMAHVEADSAARAEDLARIEVVLEDYPEDTLIDLGGDGIDPADYAVLLVIEGHHMDIKTA